jgi:hypothetical protein
MYEIVEYKLQLNENGLLVPYWVHSGGWFYNDLDKTYVGIVLDSTSRNYYIPDSVLTMSLQNVIDRVLVMQAKPTVENQSKPFLNDDYSVMSDLQIKAHITSWWNKETEE